MSGAKRPAIPRTGGHAIPGCQRNQSSFCGSGRPVALSVCARKFVQDRFQDVGHPDLLIWQTRAWFEFPPQYTYQMDDSVADAKVRPGQSESAAPFLRDCKRVISGSEDGTNPPDQASAAVGLIPSRPCFEIRGRRASGQCGDSAGMCINTALDLEAAFYSGG